MGTPVESKKKRKKVKHLESEKLALSVKPVKVRVTRQPEVYQFIAFLRQQYSLSLLLLQEPYWWRDDKFKKFKDKILRLDSKAEFNRVNQLIVRCGRCTHQVTMRNANEILRFKEHHTQSDKCKANEGKQPSINSFFPSANAVTARLSLPKEESLKVACAGIGHHQNSRITQYLSRTVMLVGGAPHRSVLRRQVLISQSRHRKFSPKELQNRIKAAERAQAQWSNDHNSGTVYSTKCTGKGIISHDKNLVFPCDECRKVLQIRIFLNALRRLPPKKDKWRYTPKAYRSELLGKAYMRHVDVQEFMEDVRVSLN